MSQTPKQATLRRPRVYLAASGRRSVEGFSVGRRIVAKGVRGIVFRKTVFEGLGASQSSAPSNQIVEIREDPLTGMRSRINLSRIERDAYAPSKHDEFVWSDLVKKTKPHCRFCAIRSKESRPAWYSRVIREASIPEDRFFLVPASYPLSPWHSIVVFDNHSVSFDRLKRQDIESFLLVATSFVKAIQLKARALRYSYIACNHMPLAGASEIHPHFQILFGTEPTNYHRTALARAKSYENRWSHGYWKDLVLSEMRLGARYVSRTETTDWVASFAPVKNHDVLGIIDGKSSISSLSHSDISGLSSGLARILKMYSDSNVHAINLAMYSEGSGEKDESQVCLRMVSRIPRLQTTRQTFLYSNDFGFMEALQWEPCNETSPEQVAANLREYL